MTDTTDSQGSRPTHDAHAVPFWIAEIDAAKKREAMFRKTGHRVLNLYSNEKASVESQTPTSVPFNIL